MITNTNQSSFTSMKQRQIRQSYQGFQSERHETSHSMNEQQDGYQTRGLIREFHIKYPVQTLLTHFRKIFNERGFKTTEVFSGKIMIVRLGFMDRVRFILSSRQPCRYLLQVKTQEYKSMRKVVIKKLKDHPNLYYQQDIQQVRQLFTCIDENPVPPPQSGRQNNVNDFEPSAEYQQDLYSLQATSTYMYHKIFVDRNYSMGRKMARLVEESKEQLSELSNKEAFIVIGGLKEITEDMLKGFNCTRKELLEILCHCRKTVQDYYLDRKFTLKTKQKIQLQRGSIQTQISQKLPQTVKSFHRLTEQPNTHKILRQIFLIKYVFDLECLINSINGGEKVALGKKLGACFGREVQVKTRVLDLWGFVHGGYQEFLSDFVN